MKSNKLRWAVILGVNVMLWCVLSFYRSSDAVQRGQQPFSNSVEQRNEMIRELREIKVLLREQNTLLRGQAKTDNHGNRQP